MRRRCGFASAARIRVSSSPVGRSSSSATRIMCKFYLTRISSCGATGRTTLRPWSPCPAGRRAPPSCDCPGGRSRPTGSRSRSRSRSASTGRRWPSRCGHPGTTRSSRSGSASPRGFTRSRRTRPPTSPRTSSRSTPRRPTWARSSAPSTRRRRAGSAGRARSRRSPSTRLASRATSRSPSRVLAAPPLALAKAQAAFALTGGLHATGLFSPDGTALRAGGRRPAQRDGQGDRLGLPRTAVAARALDPVRQRAPLVRARAEGGRRRLPVLVAVGAPSSLAVELAEDRGSRSAASSGTARRPSTPSRAAWSTDVALTGVLLVGGASRRFGSPKALATFCGETLAERAPGSSGRLRRGARRR